MEYNIFSILFRRYPHQIAQVVPKAGATSDVFDQFLKLLNISEDVNNRILFKCYIVTLFYYGIVHAALMLHGESGAAKTAKQEMVKMIVDPSEVLTLSISYDIESMAQKIAHNYVCFFDNISKISDIIQDLLCRAITGTGFMKREIFTVDEEVIYKVKHALGLTGVNLAATKADLIDRGLIIEHKPIKNKKRLIVIWEKFEALRPKLLGYIFDILVKVLQFERDNPKGLELEDYPRLADFAEVGEIISRCMGNKEMQFLEAFNSNVTSRHRKIINDSPVGLALEIFVTDKAGKAGKWEKGDWKGTMSQLLLLLKEIAKNDLELESVKNAKYWPQLPNQLSRRINEINPSLRALGIYVNRTSKDNTEKQYIIKAKSNACIVDSTNSSTVSPETQKTEVQAQSNDIKSSAAGDEVDTFSQPTKQVAIFEKNLGQKLGKYVAFDFEWDASNDNSINAASFVDSDSNSEVKFRQRDFNSSESDLLRYIMAKIIQYDWSIGWNTQGNPNNAGGTKFFDLSILHDRCKAHGITSIVKLGAKGLPYIVGDHQRIDLLNVYSKVMVKDGMYHSAYRTNKLDDVSKALLGKGKYGNYSGLDFKTLPIEEQEKYSLQDSQLVMDLSKYNNFEVLDAMLAVAEITELDFQKVCRTNLSTWWGAIFDKLVKEGKCPPLLNLEYTGSYKGADVLPPKKGLYANVVVVDAKSLYPSVGINYNLSFDAINCDCCKDNPNAKISQSDFYEFAKDCKFVHPDTDWICTKREGAFPFKLKVFKAERLRQKDLGNKAKQHALKILINGGYGVFGSADYSYYDPRVAELVTAAGRYILSKMQYSANYDYGFEIIYGDTDSLFLNNTSDRPLKEFQTKFNEKYDIELEIKNKYDKLLLSSGKKHYIGYEKGNIDSIGFEGIKSDRCEFFHQVYDQLIDDIIKQETDPLPNLRKAFSDLDSKANPNLLKITKVLNKELKEYNPTTQMYKIGHALGAKKGDLIEYYSSNIKKTGKSWTLDPAEIDIVHYKELLWNIVDEILEIAGYPIAELAKEFGIKVTKKRTSIKQDNDIVRNKKNSIGGE